MQKLVIDGFLCHICKNFGEPCLTQLGHVRIGKV
jgi:hypothetical protein